MTIAHSAVKGDWTRCALAAAMLIGPAVCLRTIVRHYLSRLDDRVRLSPVSTESGDGKLVIRVGQVLNLTKNIRWAFLTLTVATGSGETLVGLEFYQLTNPN